MFWGSIDSPSLICTCVHNTTFYAQFLGLQTPLTQTMDSELKSPAEDLLLAWVHFKLSTRKGHFLYFTQPAFTMYILTPDPRRYLPEGARHRARDVHQSSCARVQGEYWESLGSLCQSNKNTESLSHAKWPQLILCLPHVRPGAEPLQVINLYTR